MLILTHRINGSFDSRKKISINFIKWKEKFCFWVNIIMETIETNGYNFVNAKKILSLNLIGTTTFQHRFF